MFELSFPFCISNKKNPKQNKKQNKNKTKQNKTKKKKHGEIPIFRTYITKFRNF